MLCENNHLVRNPPNLFFGIVQIVIGLSLKGKESQRNFLSGQHAAAQGNASLRVYSFHLYLSMWLGFRFVSVLHCLIISLYEANCLLFSCILFFLTQLQCFFPPTVFAYLILRVRTFSIPASVPFPLPISK